MKNLKISICIPTWEQYGVGSMHLEQLFKSIEKQTFKNFNICISDHSIDEEIKKLVLHYSKYLNILYKKNDKNLGNGPANTNESIRMANGEIIKIMFQDDIFYDIDALLKIHNSFEKEKCKWLVNGCNHTRDGNTFYSNMVPTWNDNILFGVNTISSPSVLSFKNENIIFFDENLTMLMDCEYYYSLYKICGLPYILKDILVTNRVHPNQISSKYDKNINEEIRYVKEKHKV